MIDVAEAKLIYFEPERLKLEGESASPKAMLRCPAIKNAWSSTHVIRSPFDLKIYMRENNGTYYLSLGDEPYAGTLDPAILQNMIQMHQPSEWRARYCPIIQFSTGYRFFSDEKDVTLSVTPPFQHYNRWPGVMIGGEFDLYAWSGRMISWPFEWHDTSQPLIIKRGEPLFYVTFKNAKSKALVECKYTPKVAEQIRSIQNVTYYINGTMSLFKKAFDRRPRRLVEEIDR